MQIPSGSLANVKSLVSSPDFPSHQRNFRAQVEIYKQLALSAWNESIPEEKKKQKNNITEFKELEHILQNELLDFSKEDFTKPDKRIYDRVGTIAIFMYLFDKCIELDAAVAKKNKVGLYSLFDTTRKSVYKLLSEDYFKKPYVEILGQYLLDEPLLVACAELAEVDLVAIHEAVPLYQPKLSGIITSMIKAQEKEREVPKAPVAKKKKSKKTGKKK